jgi:hypothetical protein
VDDVWQLLGRADVIMRALRDAPDRAARQRCQERTPERQDMPVDNMSCGFDVPHGGQPRSHGDDVHERAQQDGETGAAFVKNIRPGLPVRSYGLIEIFDGWPRREARALHGVDLAEVAFVDLGKPRLGVEAPIVGVVATPERS